METNAHDRHEGEESKSGLKGSTSKLISLRHGFVSRSAMLCFALLALSVHIGAMLPLSIFYLQHTAVRVFWWIFWLLSLPLAAFLTLLAPASAAETENKFLYPFEGDQTAITGRLRQCILRLLVTLICPMPAVAIAGWWVFANGSASYLIEVERGVTPRNVGDLWMSSSKPSIYVFASGNDGGWHQEEWLSDTLMPLSYSIRFDFPCHGYYESETCTYESCSTDEYGYETCTDHEYECGSWNYPDRCPGYHHIQITALWTDDKEWKHGGKPSALFFRWTSYLFDYDSDMNRHINEFNPERRFEAPRLDGEFMCAFDARDGPMSSLFRENTVENKDPAGVGEHTFGSGNNRKDGDEGTSIAEEHSGFHAAGVPGYMPMLWMPIDSHKHCQSQLEKVAESNDDELKGRICLFIAFGYAIICFLLLWLCGSVKCCEQD